MRYTFPVVSVITLTLVGCSADSASDAARDVADSAGVRIVTNRVPQWAPSDAWQLADAPRLIIGRPDGDDTQYLYQVAGAVISGRRIAIANGGTHEIRFYDLTGRFVEQVGREGEGPGEFRRIDRFHRMGRDSLLVIDTSVRRVTVFDADGGFGRTVRLEDPPGSRVVPIGGFVDGRLLASELVTPGMPEQGRFRPTLTLRVYQADGSVGDSVGFDHYRETYIEVSDRGIRPWPPPFGRREMTLVHHDRFVTGSMDQYEMRIIEPSGHVRLIVRRADPLIPISTELLEAEIARLTASLPERTRGSSREHLLAAGTPDYLPTFGSNSLSRYPPSAGMVLDAADNLWVMNYPGPEATSMAWSVFGPDGVWFGNVSFPPGITPLDITQDAVLAHWRDELDVEYIGLYDLMKP